MVILVVLFATIPASFGKSRSRRKPPAEPPAVAQQEPVATSEVPIDVAYVFVKGTGILRLQDGTVSAVLPTQAVLRDLQIDSEGALWASLRGAGVVRIAGGQTANLTQESFAKLAVRSPTDVWTINDSHGSVVHYDGHRWKTVRTRNSLAGAFDDNRLVDIVSDGRAVWVSSWNGLWRVAGGRWTRVEPPPATAATSDSDADSQAPPAFPVSLLAARSGLVACYLTGCYLYTESGWQPSHWPADKARLQSAGATNLLAGIGADGRSVLTARSDGSGEAGKSETLPATGINDIAIDTSGRVWVATGAELIVLAAGGRILGRWQSDAGEIERVLISGAGPAQLPAK
jgi:hypothetical protein